MPLQCEPMTFAHKMSIADKESLRKERSLISLQLFVSGQVNVPASGSLRDPGLYDDHGVDGDVLLVSHFLVLSLELTKGALVAEGGRKTIVHQRSLVVENTPLCSVE